MADVYTDAKTHYDKLIDEGNDPVHDTDALSQYMDKWDGSQFIDDMHLAGDETVLEIGVGTGRLAIKVCGKCGEFYGIDVSPKTIEAAKNNLLRYKNAHLVCDDYLDWDTDIRFNIIYSSLTFMHIKDKQKAINKTYALLKEHGIFLLSIEKQQSSEINFGSRKVKTYPDTVGNIQQFLCDSGFVIIKQYDTEFANIFVSQK